MLTIPKNIPEKGFYYHYKHNPSLSINNYAYELIGVGMHSEDDCRLEDSNMAIYLPIYESRAFRAGKFFDLRPLEMWEESVKNKENKSVKRFTKITDPVIIEKLKEIKGEMYKGQF